MKKFTKILMLLLSLVLVATAFTVVALAADGETDATPYVVGENAFDPFKDGSFDSELSTYYNMVGTVLTNNTAKKYGRWEVGKSGYNIYLASMPDIPDSLSDTENHDFSIAPATKTYSIWNYPYYVVDFDILSTDGKFEGSIRSDLYNSGPNYRLAMGGNGVNLSALNLPSDAYVWHHITYISGYNGDGTFTFYFYVNGKLAYKYHINYNSYSVVIDGTTVSSSAFHSGAPSEVASKHWEDLMASEINKASLTFNTLSIRGYNYAGDKRQGEQWYDNFEATFFKASEAWDIDRMGNYHFTELSGGNYEFPFVKTLATVNDYPYDDINEAFAAAKAGDTVKLYEDVTEEILINKAIIVDTNKDESAKYAFNFKVADGFAMKALNGVYTFASANNAIKVVWDPECNGDEECDCNNGMQHANSASALLLPGSELSFPGIETLNFNGFVAESLGWSRTKGATVAEELTILDASMATDGVLTLYPVYTNVVKYDFSITSAEGETIYYFAKDEIALKTTAAASGSTVKLYSDIITEKSFIFLAAQNNKTYTIDLNGHSLVRLYGTFTEYQATYDASTGTYTKSGAGTAVTVGTDDRAYYGTGTFQGMFGFNNKGTTLNVKSSRPGAMMFACSVTADRLIYGNESIIENVNISSGLTLFKLYSGPNTKLNIKGENIRFYSGTIMESEHGSNSGMTLDFDGGEYYVPKAPGGYGLFRLRKGDLNVKNATFHCSGSYLIGFGGSATTPTKTVFENCDIINATPYPRYDYESVDFNNCRLDLAGISGDGTVTYCDDTIYTKEIAKAKYPDNCAIESINYSKTYTVSYPKFDSNFIPMEEYDESTTTITFVYEVANKDTDYVDVKWVDKYNNQHALSEDVFMSKYKPIIEPAVNVSIGDRYIGYTNPVWLDKDGNVADFCLGNNPAAEYTFTASMPAEPVYAGHVIPSLGYNYYGKFNALVYLPVIDGVAEAPVVSGFNPISTVMIGEDMYWAYTSIAANTTIGVSEDSTYSVTFTKNGNSYSDDIEISAIRYAEAVLKTSEDAIEKTAVANMVRLLKESRLAMGKTVDAKFDELIALGGIDELKAKEEYTDDSVDYSDLAGVISAISFKIDRTFAAYAITPADATATVKVTYADTDEELTLIDLGNSKLTNKTRVYDLDRPIKITVTTSAGTVSGTYSIKAYISNTDNTLAKAMYEFGMAVKAYRAAYIENQ